MRRPSAILLALALGVPLLFVVPAGALPATFDCGPDDGREQLTTEGIQLDFDAPAVTAPELASPVPANHPFITAQRSANFSFRANFTPYQSGDLTFRLTWPDSSDFDILVFDGEGNELGRSAESNIDGGDTRFEEVTIAAITHCADLSVAVRSWAGRPDQDLSLKISFSNPGPAFACALDDPHPACAGKAEGDAPARVEDTRMRLYLGGDRPGQAAMAGHYPFATGNLGNPPLSGSLSTQRPTGGVPNTFTHTALGNTNQNKNPFQAHFTRPFSEPGSVVGDVHALLWVSSETLKNDGILYVDLFVDGTGPLVQTRQARISVPGAQINSHPTPIRVTFRNVQIPVESDFTLQVASDAVATSGGTTGRPGDAQWTLWYDSVQFPSRVTLSLGPALSAA